ncbi:helix-turn-helix domain-containing protein [Gordonia sp. McavH-238-E]|uniref:helix-turn-helix domain-containing protein n=1 Tax=Gordonia sp. McavH-238-E TaxID=2917736 RepID=UPI0035ABB9B0
MRFGVSLRHLECAFAHHGQSPAAHLRSLRIGRACAILAVDREVTVAKVAELCGFHDVATFRRLSTRKGPASWCMATTASWCAPATEQ